MVGEKKKPKKMLLKKTDRRVRTAWLNAGSLTTAPPATRSTIMSSQRAVGCVQLQRGVTLERQTAFYSSRLFPLLPRLHLTSILTTTVCASSGSVCCGTSGGTHEEEKKVEGGGRARCRRIRERGSKVSETAATLPLAPQPLPTRSPRSRLRRRHRKRRAGTSFP